MTSPTTPSSPTVESEGYERQRAIMEAHRNESLAAYEKGRADAFMRTGKPTALVDARTYEDGFTSGWRRRAAISQAAPVPMGMQGLPQMPAVPQSQRQWGCNRER